jgi:CheY-like chemotaxis protein
LWHLGSPATATGRADVTCLCTDMAPHPRTTVLIAASGEDDRAIYFTGLALEGFAVMCGAFETGLTAAARRLLPDMVVIVLECGDDRDWDRVRVLHDDAATGHIPVVIVTSAVRPDGANRRKAWGVDNCAAFVAKPCDHRMLAAVLRRVAAGERHIEEVGRPGDFA